MSNARKCDICGQLYESYSVKAPEKEGIEVPNPEEDVNAISFGYVNRSGAIYRSRTYELCPGCMDLVTMVLGLKPKKKEE